jgi:hypothetical protein
MTATGPHHISSVDPAVSYGVDIDIIQDRNATVAAAKFVAPGATYPDFWGTGSAKLEPGDTADFDAAACLAIGRSLVTLGQYLIDNAYTEVVD